MTEDTRYVLLLRTGAKKTAHHVLPFAIANSRRIAGEHYDLWLEFSKEEEARRECTSYNVAGRAYERDAAADATKEA